jgi:hypothetical protein
MVGMTGKCRTPRETGWACRHPPGRLPVDTPKSGKGRAVVMRSGRTILTISGVGSQFTATAGFAKALAIASMAGA